ncbi:MAG: DUF4340 domain-containing protein [Lachnospiraceae bacterium]|nr:DUF4340 domain-containing protein [Lachnospiraceae bacterium]MDE6233096.1 DUF4340 domain-containing protein [Lachnospiraceae bacterium]MDE6253471.1 DUF4340 domain-containing protein [Lachnospiraceae bacterium]
MKKKKVMPFIILAVLFVALIISYSFLVKYNKEQEETTGEESESIISCQSSSILNISITNPSGTMKFDYDISGSVWKYTDDEAFPLEESYITSLLGNACALNAARHLEDTLDNISEYGLDNPQYTLSISGDEGTEITLYIGDSNSTGNYYAYLDGSSTVYMIDSTLPDALGKSLNDIVKLEELPSISTSDVYSIEFNGNTYEYFEGGNPQYDYTNSNNWFKKMDDGSYKAMDTQEINNVLTSITGIAYTGCADYNVTQEELTQYGLDEANAKKIVERYYVTESGTSEEQSESSSETESATEDNIVKEPHEITFYVGSKNEDGNYYVKSSEGTAVNLVAADTIDAILGAEETSLISKNVLSINLDIVKSMIVAVNGKTFNVVENGEVTDTDKYDSIYQDINAVTAESTISDNTAIQPVQPELTVTYTVDSEYFNTVTMEYTQYNGSFYQVTINGNTELLVVKSAVDNIISKLQQIE